MKTFRVTLAPAMDEDVTPAEEEFCLLADSFEIQAGMLVFYEGTSRCGAVASDAWIYVEQLRGDSE